MKEFYEASLYVCADIYTFKNIFSIFRKEKEFECKESYLPYKQIYYCDNVNDAIEKHQIRLEREGLDKLIEYAIGELVRMFDSTSANSLIKVFSSEARNFSYQIRAIKAECFNNKSLQYMMKELEAEDFISYCKDRGIYIGVDLNDESKENNL